MDIANIIYWALMVIMALLLLVILSFIGHVTFMWIAEHVFGNVIQCNVGG